MLERTRCRLRQTSTVVLGVAGLLAIGGGVALASFTAAVDYPVESEPVSIAVSDFDRDGRLDLAVANSNASSVSVLEGKTNGAFKAAVHYPVYDDLVPGDDPSPRSIAVGDFNRDGDRDLVTANQSEDNVSVFRGRSGATFRTPDLEYPVGGDQPVSMAVGDLDRDGRQDLAVVSAFNTPDVNTGDGEVSILEGRANGAFKAPVDYPLGDGPKEVVVGKFDGNRRPDLAVTNSGEGSVAVLLGQANDTFADAVEYPAGVGGASPLSMAIGDFDRDGNQDLVATHVNEDDVSILEGNGDGTFDAPVDYPVGARPESVVVADFNRDGDSDLAVGNKDDDNVSILDGAAALTFEDAVPYEVGGAPQALARGRFNADRKQDLAAANRDDDDVSVLLNG